MEPHLTKPFQNYYPPLDSLNSSKTLPESLPISPRETLGLFDYDDNLSPVSEKTVLDNDNSDYDSFLEEADGEEGENEGSVLINSSPIRSSNCSHWAEPWSTMSDPKPVVDNWSSGAVEENKSSGSDWTDWPSTTDLQIRPSVSALFTEYKPYYFVGAGLANLGNTCFLNAVLQCFTHTVPLLQGIISCNHKMPCDGFFEGFCVFCALREHIELSLVSTGRVVSPWKFVNNLNYFSSGFGRFQQEDAHEFLQCFLDKLESCSNSMLKDTMSPGNNFVKQVFGGRLVSKLQCCNCGHSSDTYEPSIDLSLEIDDADTLSSALESFTKIEKIEDPETKFTCEECKEQVAVEKQLMLDQVPSVAAFHLKRFKNDGSVVEKIDKFVAFPLELDLQPYTAGGQVGNAELRYDLYAVVVHIGFSSCSGHYYCFIRSADDVWFKFDDSKVVWVREEYVLSQEAYILFYAKQGTPWFSSFIQTQKQCIDLAILNTSPKSVLDNLDASTSSSSLSLNYCGDVNETSDSTEVFMETSSGSIGGKTNDCEDKENKVPVTVPFVASNSTDVPSCEAAEQPSESILRDKNSNQEFIEVKNVADVSPTDVPSCEVAESPSESILRDKNSNQEFVEVKNVADVSPKTPSRSPSPEIYREDPPESTFSIPRGHLRSAEHVSCKKQLNKDLENFEMKQAYKLVKKNIGGSRGEQLLQAMTGSLSAGSLNKKRSRITEDRSTSGRRKGRIAFVASTLR